MFKVGTILRKEKLLKFVWRGVE